MQFIFINLKREIELKINYKYEADHLTNVVHFISADKKGLVSALLNRLLPFKVDGRHLPVHLIRVTNVSFQS